ncbi:MAG TPA: thermonuclease family protein [Thermomicrobiales bacterium]|nr:thermonuclease family protein [Thermomicrobiales bacterium]
MNRRWWIVCLLVAALASLACEATPATPARAPVSGPTATRASLSDRATQTDGADGQTPPAVTAEATTADTAGELAWVERVVDGDTIMVEIAGRVERLRYIGVDAPESVRPDYPVECFGPEASKENARLVGGQEVDLVRDVSNRDRFGRLLRYVYVRDPATGERVFVNLRLVEEGYANAVTFPPDLAHVDELRVAERQAREEGRGLWGACPSR